MYPSSFIPKILPWLRCSRGEVLHVCSGGLPPGEGIRVDIRPEARPDIIADGRRLPLLDGSVASHLLREAARVVRHGGRIGFVHYITPNPPPGCHVEKVFGLSVGFGFPMRAVTIYEREGATLPLGERGIR